MKTKRSDITDKQRKDLGACEHDNVNYKALESLNKLLFQKLEYKDFKVIEHLQTETLNLRNDITLLQRENEDKQAEVNHYKEAIQKIGPQYAEALNKDEEQFKGFKSYGSKGTPKSTLLESGKVVSKIRKKDAKK